MVVVVDDDAMLALVDALLDDPDLQLNPEAMHDLLSRLRELLAQETARRPAHRPRDTTGATVAMLAEFVCLARAKRLVAAMRKKPLPTVARAYERWRKRQE